jgi:drug/metabolite transporter (DMT)-like permease
MTLTAFYLILISAVLHAGWNFISKTHRPSVVFYAQSSGTAALFWLPMLLYVRPDFTALPLAFWSFLLGSVVFNVIYYTGLAHAYARSDISMAYPMARSLPVLLTALITVLFNFGTPPGVLTWLGLILISCGCLILPLPSLKDFNWKTYRTPVLGFIILAACGTTGYTIVDSFGIKLAITHLPEVEKIHGCIYMSLVEPLNCLGLLIVTAFSKNNRLEFQKSFARSVWPSLSGIACSLAYVLILAAMPFVTNVSFVQAFRQMSLPLCITAGIVILHERCTLTKVIGCLAIVAGLLLTSI